MQLHLYTLDPIMRTKFYRGRRVRFGKDSNLVSDLVPARGLI